MKVLLLVQALFLGCAAVQWLDTYAFGQGHKSDFIHAIDVSSSAWVLLPEGMYARKTPLSDTTLTPWVRVPPYEEAPSKWRADCRYLAGSLRVTSAGGSWTDVGGLSEIASHISACSNPQLASLNLIIPMMSKIAYTTDGGLTWAEKKVASSQVDDSFVAGGGVAAMASASEFYFCGVNFFGETEFYRTSDSGDSWTSVSSYDPTQIYLSTNGGFSVDRTFRAYDMWADTQVMVVVGAITSTASGFHQPAIYRWLSGTNINEDKWRLVSDSDLVDSHDHPGLAAQVYSDTTANTINQDLYGMCAVVIPGAATKIWAVGARGRIGDNSVPHFRAALSLVVCFAVSSIDGGETFTKMDLQIGSQSPDLFTVRRPCHPVFAHEIGYRSDRWCASL